MKNVITELDILSGIPGSSTQCPVARAIRRATNSSHVTVGQMMIHTDHHRYACPRLVADFVFAFDSGVKVAPMEFDLC